MGPNLSCAGTLMSLSFAFKKRKSIKWVGVNKEEEIIVEDLKGSFLFYNSVIL